MSETIEQVLAENRQYEVAIAAMKNPCWLIGYKLPGNDSGSKAFYSVEEAAKFLTDDSTQAERSGWIGYTCYAFDDIDEGLSLNYNLIPCPALNNI